MNVYIGAINFVITRMTLSMIFAAVSPYITAASLFCCTRMASSHLLMHSGVPA